MKDRFGVELEVGMPVVFTQKHAGYSECKGIVTSIKNGKVKIDGKSRGYDKKVETKCESRITAIAQDSGSIGMPVAIRMWTDSGDNYTATFKAGTTNEEIEGWLEKNYSDEHHIDEDDEDPTHYTTMMWEYVDDKIQDATGMKPTTKWELY